MSVDGGGPGGRSLRSDPIRGALLVVVAVAVGLLLLTQGVVDDEVSATGRDGDEAAQPATEGDPAPAVPDDGGATTTTSTTVPETTTTTSAPPAVRQPGEVRVLVLNGSGRSGEAGRGTQFFADAGYDVAEAENAPSNGPSAIFHTEGFEAEAEAAAAALGVDPAAVVQPIDPAAPPAPDLQDADLVVVAGTDGTISF